MTTRATTRAEQRAQIERSRRRRRTILWWSLGGVVAILVVLGVLLAVVASKALTVRDSLTAAIPVATGLPQKIIAGDAEGAAADADAVRKRTSAAVAETEGVLWRAAEVVPFVGPNLAAVRSAAEGVDALARFAVDAAPRLDLAAFRPVGGAIDLAAVHTLSDLVSEGAEVTSGVLTDLRGIDRAALVPQVASAVTQLDDVTSRLHDTLSPIAPILEVLPAALGEGAPRTYLLMFQGNSELRASGGNPAALALVTASEGQIALTAQATSMQFDNARAESIAALDPETEQIYSDILGRWIPNMTATPNFPTTVEIMKAWWVDEELPPFDDVVSVDPVALSYLLKATGPIALTTGETLTADNAVSLLLNEVYFNYGEGTNPAEQDVFFAAAAAQIFSTLTTGISNPVAFVDGLTQATDEGRLKIWSSNPDIEALISGTKLAGMLPADNDEETVAGVYFNDTTGAKTDYYADATISATTDQCTAAAEPTFTQTITFANNVTQEQADDLPYFIAGKNFTPGTIVTDVVVYTPVGASIESWAVTGASEHLLVSQGTHLGRSVVRISVTTTPQTAATITVTMKGAEGVAASTYGGYDVWTTPMVRDTPVTIDAPGCG
jgi:hypothetical protein